MIYAVSYRILEWLRLKGAWRSTGSNLPDVDKVSYGALSLASNSTLNNNPAYCLGQHYL